MSGQSLNTDGFVLARRPPTDSFQGFSVFSAEQGLLSVMMRLPKKSSPAALDLFDEASFTLESSSQGQTWFVKESRLLSRHAGLGRGYETLQRASDLARLIVRNAVAGEGRPRVCALLREAFAALASSDRPDIVYLKSLYRFARDEGYPVREQWAASLPGADREALASLLNRPLAAQVAEPSFVTKMTGSLDRYLRAETEILLD